MFRHLVLAETRERGAILKRVLDVSVGFGWAAAGIVLAAPSPE